MENPATASVFSLNEESLSDMYQIGLKSPTLSLNEKATGRGVEFKLDAGGNIPWYAVTTWAQTAQSDFFCVEPWTGLPNAIHHGKGLRYLAPGAKENAVCILRAR
jgi:aldose 1-epimerase